MRRCFLLIAVFGMALTAAAAQQEELWIDNGSRHIFGVLNKIDDGQRHPIVIVAHGFNGWYKPGMGYFEPLARMGYHTYTFDFPCGSLGSRSGNNTMNMSVVDEIGDLQAIVRYFKQRTDVDNIVLAGESQGGLVAALTAARMPNDVSKLILCFPAFCIASDWTGRYPVADMIPDTTRVWDVPVGKRFFHEVRALRPFMEIKEYKNPVLIVQGDKDSIVPVKDSQRAVNTYNNATLRIIPGAGHGYNDIEFKQYMDYVVSFLSSQTSKSTTFSGSCKHSWQGKRVAYLGDSITDPNNNGSKTKYWGFLSDWLQMEPYVYGVSGQQWSDIPQQADKLKTEHGDDVDAIIIFMGTNDYNSGVSIGEWFTERKEKVMAGIHEKKHLVDRIHRYPAMNQSTYRGRINKALDYVKRMYPTKQIVLLTPIHRAEFYCNDKNWQPHEDYTNLCGTYIDAYVQSVKEAGNIWAVPVIDLNALCGLYPLMDEYTCYFKDAGNDRLHPNDDGHRRMALTIMQQLLALPVF